MRTNNPDVLAQTTLASLATDQAAWTVEGLPAGVSSQPEQKPVARVLVDGLITGLLGYAALALFFAVVSMVNGHSPFHIAALLATALFRLPTDAIAVEPGPIIAYNGLHLLVLLVAGMLLAGLARVAARAFQGWYLAVIAVVFVAAHIVALPIWFGDRVSAELTIWLVVLGTALAAVVMSGYLWIANPDIRTAMHEPDE